MADQADQGFNPQASPQGSPQHPTEQSPPQHGATESTPQPGTAPSESTTESAAEALDKVTEAAEKVVSTTQDQVAPPTSSAGLDMPQFDQPANTTVPPAHDAKTNGASGSGLERLDDVELDVQIELGRTRMYVQDVLRLNADSVIELERAAGDPVDIRVNGQLVARGEVLVVDETLCVRIGEIVEETQGAI